MKQFFPAQAAREEDQRGEQQVDGGEGRHHLQGGVLSRLLLEEDNHMVRESPNAKIGKMVSGHR